MIVSVFTTINVVAHTQCICPRIDSLLSNWIALNRCKHGFTEIIPNEWHRMVQVCLPNFSQGRHHYLQIDGLMQERRNCIAHALELRLSCTNPSKLCRQHNPIHIMVVGSPSPCPDTILHNATFFCWRSPKAKIKWLKSIHSRQQAIIWTNVG